MRPRERGGRGEFEGLGVRRAARIAQRLHTTRDLQMSPQSDPDDGALAPFSNSIWTATTPIRFAGTLFPHVMTLVRLAPGDLVIHSPCRPSDRLVSEIAALGRVTDIIAPNWFHDLYLSEYRALYPCARFWGPRFLKRLHKSSIDDPLEGVDRPPWAKELPYVTLSGWFSFDESVFCHVASRTLIVADLLMNVVADAQTPTFTKLGYWFFGLHGQLKVFPILKWFGLTSRASLRRVREQIFEWGPERLIVAHGKPIAHDVASQLREAFSWLGP